MKLSEHKNKWTHRNRFSLESQIEIADTYILVLEVDCKWLGERVAQLEEENELVKLLVTSRVKGEWPDGMNGDPDDWEEWSLQLYGHEAGDLLLGQEAWDHIVRGLKQEPE